MLTKKLWEFSNICVIDISTSNNFITVSELIPIDKSYDMDFFNIYTADIFVGNKYASIGWLIVTDKSCHVTNLY